MCAVADGLTSALAALAALALSLPPAWFTHLAVQGGLAPIWTYAPALPLALVGLLLGAASAGKALAGIAPGRNRRR